MRKGSGLHNSENPDFPAVGDGEKNFLPQRGAHYSSRLETSVNFYANQFWADQPQELWNNSQNIKLQ